MATEILELQVTAQTRDEAIEKGLEQDEKWFNEPRDNLKVGINMVSAVYSPDYSISRDEDTVIVGYEAYLRVSVKEGAK